MQWSVEGEFHSRPSTSVRSIVLSLTIRTRSVTDLDGPLCRGDPDDSTPPMAPGAVPVLGHALRYKKDPPGFMVLYILMRRCLALNNERRFLRRRFMRERRLRGCVPPPFIHFTPNRQPPPSSQLPISPSLSLSTPGHAAPLQAAQAAQLGGVFQVKLAGLNAPIPRQSGPSPSHPPTHSA